MAPGDARQVDVTVQTPDAVTLFTVDYESADAAVVQVTQSGLVSAVAVGEAVITVRATRLDTGSGAQANLIVRVAPDGGDAPPAPGARVATFTSSNVEYPAADRGFYVTPKPSEMNASTLNGFAQAWGNRLFMFDIELGAYRAQVLPQSFLTNLTSQLGALRSVGAKAILMPVYSTGSSCEDAPLAIVKQHLAQLKPIFAANADVIAYFRAGITGAWGEGWCSTNGLDEEPARSQLRDALFDAVPSQFHVAFQVVVLDAYAAYSRVAAKNDCFMATDDDAHNLPGGLDTPLRDFLKVRTDITPYGGETCDNSAAGSATARRYCDEILREGAEYHLAHLNQSYSPLFINTWKDEGCFEQVRRSIGYRLELAQVSHPETAAGSATFEVSVRNVGWARTFSKRRVVVTLVEKTSGRVVSGSAGDLNSVGAGTTSTFAVTVSAPAGTYAVHVSAPDIYPTTASNPLYAVRFANSDAGTQRWDAASARFATGTELTLR